LIRQRSGGRACHADPSLPRSSPFSSHALAYNLGNFMRTLAIHVATEPWSLTSLREKLINIGQGREPWALRQRDGSQPREPSNPTIWPQNEGGCDRISLRATPRKQEYRASRPGNWGMAVETTLITS
jgi:hypothetical protein